MKKWVVIVCAVMAGHAASGIVGRENNGPINLKVESVFLNAFDASPIK